MTDSTKELTEAERREEFLWKYIRGLNGIIDKKQKSLIHAWSHFNGIENKSDDDKKVYASIIEGINADHNPISKEEIEQLINE